MWHYFCTSDYFTRRNKHLKSNLISSHSSFPIPILFANNDEFYVKIVSIHLILKLSSVQFVFLLLSLSYHLSLSNHFVNLKALVGIAFSVGFIVGPVIGALFARWSHGQMGNWYMTPALFAFTLSFTNILFIAIYFKETLPKVFDFFIKLLFWFTI